MSTGAVDSILSRVEAFRMAQDVTAAMVRLVGTQAIYSTSILDRLVRDAITINQHVAAGPVMLDAAGRLASASSSKASSPPSSDTTTVPSSMLGRHRLPGARSIPASSRTPTPSDYDAYSGYRPMPEPPFLDTRSFASRAAIPPRSARWGPLQRSYRWSVSAASRWGCAGGAGRPSTYRCGWCG